MLRFWILVGVSTSAQATEIKDSIPNQIATCRARIAQYHGQEVGLSIMDGDSRNDYDSLEVAMQAIPELGRAIQAAMRDEYDVLILDNYDRLGDLGLMVGTRFRKLHKQLHSARQSGKIVPPAEYDPYNDESTDIDMYVEGIINRYRNNKLRRAWRVGVPKRARLGLHPLSYRFGYQTKGKDQPAEQVPDQIALLRQMKDAYLAGQTLTQICQLAADSGIQPARSQKGWQRNVIKRMLLNPYYAGLIVFGKHKLRDKKTRLPNPPSSWITAPGLHQPAWDAATYHALLAEAERRDSTRNRAKTYAISGLLICSTCGQKLYRHGRLTQTVYMICPAKPAHVQIEYNLALQIVSQKVINALRKPQDAPNNQIESPVPQIDELRAQRAQVQSGYQRRIYTEEEASAQITAIENELQRLLTQAEKIQRQQTQRQRLLSQSPAELDTLQEWLQHADPTTVHQFLTALLASITITPYYDLNLHWR